MRKMTNVIARREAPKQSNRSDCFVVAALLLAMTFLFVPKASCEDKSWNAGGDKTDWFDDANWLPAAKPTASDDTLVDMLDADVDISQTFAAKSLTLGGKKPSALTVDNFVTGEIAPANKTDVSLHNRRDGFILMKGSAGKMTLKGTYKSSREAVPDEPSFMLYVQ